MLRKYNFIFKKNKLKKREIPIINLVNDFVNEFGMKRKYSHQIKSRIYPKSLKGDSILLSWPPQVSELKQLKEWKDIEDELNNLPDVKNKNNFQDYAISIMGQTLYELFIEGYTIKQWGKEPNKLSAEFLSLIHI